MGLWNFLLLVFVLCMSWKLLYDLATTRLQFHSVENDVINGYKNAVKKIVVLFVDNSEGIENIFARCIIRPRFVRTSGTKETHARYVDI